MLTYSERVQYTKYTLITFPLKMVVKLITT